MQKLFWYLLTGISGALIGTALVEFLTGRAGEITIYLLIAGLVLAAISAWGAKKYAGIGFFSNKK